MKLYARGYRWSFVGCVLLSIMQTLFLVLQLLAGSHIARALVVAASRLPSPLVLPASKRLGRLLDYFQLSDSLAHLLCIFLVLQGLRMLTHMITRRFMERLGFAGRDDVRRNLYASVSKLHPRMIDAPMRGRLVHLIGEGVEALFYYYGFFLPQALSGVLGPIIIIAIIALVDPISAIVLGVCIPLMPLIMRALFSKFRAATIGYRAQLSSMMELYMESLHALGSLRLLGFSRRWGYAIRDRGEELKSSTMGLLKVNQLMIFAMDLLFSLGVLMLAALLVVVRYETLGAAAGLFLLFASVELMRPMMLLGSFFYFGAIGREIKRETQEIAALPTLPERSAPAQVSEARDVLLKVEGVDFAYSEGRQILKDFDLELRQGEFVVISGKSGSGKSTLFSLIEGSLDPQKGSIYAEPFGYVRQKPYLFEGSLKENIELGLGDEGELSEEAYKQLLVDLDLLDIASQRIKRDGEGISGGQASRIALARALCSPAKWFLIDEGTAGLDAETEARIIARIRALAREKGVLMISHSARLIAEADRVIELGEGGTHASSHAKIAASCTASTSTPTHRGARTC